MLLYQDGKSDKVLDLYVLNNWRVRERIYNLIAKLLVSYGERHEKWKGYEAAFNWMLDVYVCGFKDSAVKVRESMIESISQVCANAPIAAGKIQEKIKERMWWDTPRHMGEIVPKHQKVIAMLYINREMIKYLGERGEGNQTDPYSQDFLDAVTSSIPNIQFVAFKCLAECGRYLSQGMGGKIKDQSKILLAKENEIDVDVAAFCAAFMKNSN